MAILENGQPEARWEYYLENHDWDMTLAAARELLKTGQAIQAEKGECHHLSHYSGAMLLSFCAFESFINSLAFLTHRSGRGGLNYRRYTRINGLWGRVDALAIALNITVQRSRQPFVTIEDMRKWRNEMVHSQPFSVEPVLIASPDRGHEVAGANQSYLTRVTRRDAHSFYRAALVGIARLKRASGLDPTTHVSYRNLATNQTVRIARQSVKLASGSDGDSPVTVT